MLFENVHIEAISYFLPDSVLSSSDIEKHLKPLYDSLHLAKGTLESLTGVKERRLWSSDTMPSSLAVEAGKRVVRSLQIKPHEIDLLIYAGVCRDFIEPATAHIIHHELGLGPHCLTFDLSNACLGFLSAMMVAGQMIDTGRIETAMLVSGENASPLLEKTVDHLLRNPTEEAYRSALASLTLGSGAVAMILRHKKNSMTKHKLIGGVSEVASQHHKLCRGQGDYSNPLMYTDSRRLLEAGVSLSQNTWQNFLKKLNWAVEEINHIVTHQVSVAHHAKLFEKLGIDTKKSSRECVYLGNTGTVAAPLSMALANENKKLGNGDRIALLGIGSGLNTMMLGVEW